MDHEKADDRRHAEEMHEPDGLEAAEQRRQLGELHRFPQRQPGDHDEDADRHNAEIENLLHGVVMRQILVREAKAQRVADGRHDLAQRQRKQLLPKPSGGDAIGEIGEPVDDEYPHAEKVPLQPVLRPLADHDGVREMQKAEEDVVVVDLPAAADHDENGDRIGPMHDADRQRVQALLLARI